MPDASSLMLIVSRCPITFWKLSTWFLIVSLALFVGLSCFFLRGPPGISLFSDPSAHACVADFTMILEDIPHDHNGGMSALCRCVDFFNCAHALTTSFGQEVQTLRSSTAISDSGVFARIFGPLGPCPLDRAPGARLIPLPQSLQALFFAFAPLCPSVALDRILRPNHWLARMDWLESLPLSMRCVFQSCVRNPLELWTGLLLFCRLPGALDSL